MNIHPYIQYGLYELLTMEGASKVESVQFIEELNRISEQDATDKFAHNLEFPIKRNFTGITLYHAALTILAEVKKHKNLNPTFYRNLATIKSAAMKKRLVEIKSIWATLSSCYQDVYIQILSKEDPHLVSEWSMERFFAEAEVEKIQPIFIEFAGIAPQALDDLSDIYSFEPIRALAYLELLQSTQKESPAYTSIRLMQELIKYDLIINGNLDKDSFLEIQDEQNELFLL